MVLLMSSISFAVEPIKLIKEVDGMIEVSKRSVENE